jgi:hypothetical protein
MSQLQFILRDATPEDHPFIFDAFFRSYRDASPLRYCQKRIYYPGQKQVIQFLLDTQKTLIACFPEDPETIMAYILYGYGPDNILIIHYLYVKNDLRNKGIAIEMVETLVSDNPTIICTHITDNFDELRHAVPGAKVVFDPFYLINQRLNAAR